ncbi:autoinducer 2 import system permease LsrD (plasmid) [Deinococcus metallilatus]|uniref:Autoinducer 2 import system permease protein LsrD n=1 Tax=Deinococcus metallilatus TaxID=1211322 RepID=A0AAJ5JZV4_9DEIO|nr:autoinducer 2 import system permease LsrD [Deinococcus metallilatus]MBB5293499.1 AI-2 transport system permease protein [Deinococcus metallilatus]QBY06580.1 autoinducer 2 import system permease LsrD [Deinococcus metallilatus]RXJ17923.1 autoinducer 2 import system permease LsrD [Deinococcus metallilatus]TLK32194.1 autoinducer 2 import system permease LsrD [Deinococcus metallilatus]GMA15281.1 autoinducer 2 import system permease protein LsrD [Deinococcus metallilatus]
MKSLRGMGWEVGLLVALILELLLFSLLNSSFANLGNLLMSTSDFIAIGIVALGLTLVVVGGGIDVSVGSTVSLAAITMGVAWSHGIPLVLACLLGLLAGAAAGALNAFLITVTQVQPLVITLATLYLYGGLALLLSGTVGANGYEGISGFPDAFSTLANGTVGPIPYPLLLFVGLALLVGLLLGRSRYGRQLYLIGSNDRTARYSGLPVRRVRTWSYVIAGVLAALAGLVLSSYFSSARADLGSTALLPALTAVVLGGASIYGGSGSILGTVLAVFIVGYLQIGLQAVGVSSQISNTLSGVLLIAAVALRTLTLMLTRWHQNRRVLRQTKGGPAASP